MLIAAAEFVLRLQKAARDAVEWIETAATSLSATHWVLVAVAAGAVAWVVTNVRALTRLGPIELQALEHDTAANVPVKALTATFREALARTGLVPPPRGSVGHATRERARRRGVQRHPAGGMDREAPRARTQAAAASVQDRRHAAGRRCRSQR